MKYEWTKKKLSDIADFNPRETIKKGAIAKKIPMVICSLIGRHAK